MGTLGGEEAFFLVGLELAVAGGVLVAGTTGLGEARGDLAGDESEELSVTVAGEEILACRITLARRSERD